MLQNDNWLLNAADEMLQEVYWMLYGVDEMLQDVCVQDAGRCI